MPAGGSGNYSGPGVNNNVFTPSNAGAGNHHITYTYTYNGCAGDTFAIITVMVCPGINEIDNDLVKVYPNPTENKLNIDFSELPENTELNMYDMHGRLIYKETIPQSDKAIHKVIDLSSEPKGIYFIKLVNTNVMMIKKIVLK